MAVSIISGTNNKPAASRVLAEIVGQCDGLSGKLFIGYPVLATHAGRLQIDALWASGDAGFVAFDLVEGTDLSGHRERQEDYANAIESALRSHRNLVKRSGKQRNLLVPVHTATFAPGVSTLPADRDSDSPVTNAANLARVLADFRWTADGAEPEFNAALAALENIAAIRRPSHARSCDRPDSRGAKLKRLEDSLATLDEQQARAVIETAAGIQRIRGLAGSGKTIVLALKAAYLHARHPDWRIAVTFQTRSLKAFFRQLITRSFVSQTRETPDWKRLRIIHAWGAPGGEERDGIYHQFCRATGATYLDYGRARMRLGPTNPFKGACGLALKEAELAEHRYDAILVDEAQDLHPEFLRICYRLLTPQKRLVYAYDELQNLGRESLPGPDRIFSREEDRPRDDTPMSDIVLKKCYRNSRPVLTTAHALGFGINRPAGSGKGTGIVQMFDDPEMWRDVGYRAVGGPIREGEPVVLARTDDTSPRFLENHSEINDLVQFVVFNTQEEQATWVAEQVEWNIRNDELAPEDIGVINPDPLSTAEGVGAIRAMLFNKDIPNHLAGVDTGVDVFRQDDSVTFTGIYRAKGNEFGMVYVVNAHDCHAADHNLSVIRNRLFTAITRSKAWVRVCGVGEAMEHIAEEHAMLKNADYTMRFVYPTESQRREMRIVHRELSDERIKRLEAYRSNMSSLIKDVKAGHVYPEDLGEIAPKLQELLAVREERHARGEP